MRTPHLALAVSVAVLASAARRASAQESPAPAAPSAPPAAQPPPPPVVEGRILRLPGAAPFDVGCEGRAVERLGDRVFVACGAEGVVEIDASNPQAPRRSGRMPLESGEATGLFVRDGRVWVEIAHMQAMPVRVQQGTAQPAAPSSASPEPATTVREPEPQPRQGSILAPPRRGGLWELSAMLGGFANIGPVGGGGFGWASAVYRFDAPIVFRAEIAPVVLGFENNGVPPPAPGFVGTTGQTTTSSALLGAGQVLVGLDTQFVEVAVGLGASSVSRNYSTAGNSNGGPAIVEEGRFGARDGLALSVEASTVAANNQFQMGFLQMELQVPLSHSFMLTARGGGGAVGLLYGDLGARYLLRGDGGPDTLAIKGFFGGAGIDYQTCPDTTSGCTYISEGGPSVGGGIEWRR